MKKMFFVSLLSMLGSSVFAQKDWFTVYTDSLALVKDANLVASQFIADAVKAQPSIKFDVKAILNTTPYLIYYEDNGKVKTVNLPLWSQVIQEQKAFFYEVAGSEADGKKVFGLFFNGFYVPHELGHAMQEIKDISQSSVSYKNEYFANMVAIMWWKKQQKTAELQQCYEYAKKMFAKLPNPVTDGSSVEAFFTKNYEEASQNPYTYGYMQFKQFIEIYETKNLPDFDTFVSSYLKK